MRSVKSVEKRNGLSITPEGADIIRKSDISDVYKISGNSSSNNRPIETTENPKIEKIGSMRKVLKARSIVKGMSSANIGLNVV